MEPGFSQVIVANGRALNDIAASYRIEIDGKTVVLDTECLAGRNRPYGLYTLRISAHYYDDTPAKVFVYHAHAKKAPADSEYPKDEFMCVADALDMDEIPPDSPDIEAGVPYYRTDSVELCFRNSDMMYECRDSICGVTM